MTYKSAVAGINLGGGKSVIIGDNRRQDREALFRAHGRFVETLNGRYITAEDIGTTPADMEYIKLETDHVAGLLGLSGDPSPVTAYGVYVGMKAAAKARWGETVWRGRRWRCRVPATSPTIFAAISTARACVSLSPTSTREGQRVVDEFGATPVAPDAIYDQQADIYAPCALGATINDDTIPRLKVKIVAGAANNQLAEDRHGDELERRGMLYAPDYVINGGGVINVYGELHRWPAERSLKKKRGRFTRPCCVSSRSPGQIGFPPTGRRIDWPSSASRRWRGWIACGWGAGASAAPSTAPMIPCTLGKQMPEVIPIGADHAGFELKRRLLERAAGAGIRAARHGDGMGRSRPTIPITPTRSPPG